MLKKQFLTKRVLTNLIILVPGMILASVFHPLDYLGVSAQQAGCQTFPQTGKTVCGRFVQYWQPHSRQALQGYPVSAVQASGPPVVPGDENWDAAFGFPGVDNAVSAIATSGNYVYVGGSFVTAGGTFASRIAKWNSVSNTWSALGSGLNGPVNAIAVLGTDVFVGGQFTTAGGLPANSVARWDTTSNQWFSLGSGPNNGVDDFVAALTVNGSDLYVGGNFINAGGMTVNKLARWDGSQWHDVGGGTDSGATVLGIAFIGSDMYVGGSIAHVGGGTMSVNNIARWDGSQWHSLDGGGTNGTTGTVYSLAVAANGTDLYVGGFFDMAGGLTVNNIAKWDSLSNQWSPLGSGVTTPQGVGYVLSVVVAGGSVFVGGGFALAGSTSVTSVARWDLGTGQWFALGNGLNVAGNGSSPQVNALAISNTGGNMLFVGGQFNGAGDGVALHVSKWDINGSQWSALSGATGQGLNGSVTAIAVSGNSIYVGGAFTFAGEVHANHIARWDGSQWHSLGTGSNNGVSGSVYSIAVSGNTVYVGGLFNSAGLVSANNIAMWDSTTSQWAALGSGATNGVNGYALAIAISGASVYVGGDFEVAGGVSANRIARWDSVGGQWNALGSGADDFVRAIAVIGNNVGSAVFVGGDFRHIGNLTTRGIARWDLFSDQWYPLVSGTTTGVTGPVYAIAASGTDIFVGGAFNQAGTLPVSNIARWASSASQWHTVGTTGTDNLVDTLTSSGGIIYAGGTFRNVGGVSADFIARWDPSNNQWYPLGSSTYSSTGGYVLALSPAIVSNGNVYAGGIFTQAGGKPSNYLGWWHDPTLQRLANHVTWQGRLAQPSARQQLPITLTLKLGTTEVNYPSQTTDSSGFFTVSVGTLASGTYDWRVKAPKYLANAGQVTLQGTTVTNLEMGLMRTGDANSDNVVNTNDFNILKTTFGTGCGVPGYDDRADFNGDCGVDTLDFNLLKTNFGFGGAPPIEPGKP